VRNGYLSGQIEKSALMILYCTYHCSIGAERVGYADQQKEPCRRHGNFSTPPKKTAGRHSVPPAKKPPEWATKLLKVLYWWLCIPKLEPILTQKTN
jgi:hypothetical protein